MRINNSLPNPNVGRPASQVPPQQTSSQTSESAQLDASTHAPSAELARLLDSLRQVPQLREEVVREVAQRLSAGELNTRAAVERTVDSILRASGRSI